MKFKDRTRSGYEYKIYEENVDTGTKYTTLGAIKIDNKWRSIAWTKTGANYEGEIHNTDLIPEQEELWVNIYSRQLATGFLSWKEARQNAGSGCIATVKVTYYPGQGLEREE